MANKIELTREQIDNIIELYESGLTQRKIANIVGLSDIMVSRLLKKEGIKARSTKDYAKLFDDETDKEIVKQYLDGSNLKQLAEKYNCSRKAISNALTRCNIEKRTPSEAYRTYDIDDHYFDEIDNQDKAYILGFLYADGCNSSKYDMNHYAITLLLQMEDMYILEEMRQKIGIERPIGIVINNINKKPYPILGIYNKHMVFQLDKWGVVPNKTRKTQFPYWMEKDLYPHFIRGLLDGDGCIPKCLDRVNFCGSHKLMCDLGDVINDEFGFKPVAHPYKCSKGISHIEICATWKRLAFLDWIYKDADMKLSRKYELYLKMKEEYGYKLVG